MSHRLADLPYAETALEPHLSAEWVERQRDWQQRYVARLDSLLAGTEWESVPTEKLLHRLHDLPADLRDPVREAAGGHLNHHLLWQSLGPDGGGEPGYELLDDIEASFGSFPAFQAAVRSAAESRADEGWVWLVWNAGDLEVVATELEHTPLDHQRAPVLGIDLWAHAYEGIYPDRGAYVDAIWHVVDWRAVAERFLAAEEASRERGDVR